MLTVEASKLTVPPLMLEPAIFMAEPAFMLTVSMASMFPAAPTWVVEKLWLAPFELEVFVKRWLVTEPSSDSKLMVLAFMFPEVV